MNADRFAVSLAPGQRESLERIAKSTYGSKAAALRAALASGLNKLDPLYKKTEV